MHSSENASLESSVMSMMNLGYLTYAGGHTHWVYASLKPFADCLLPGFFAPAADTFAPGDLIIISALDGVGIRTVQAAVNGRVVLAELL